MLKRLSLAGWQPILVNKTSRTHKNSVSRHAQFYVSQMLEFIAAHYDQALTVNAVAEHVKLNPNYAMGVFQRVMQQTMKQYITASAYQSCAGAAERYRQDHPWILPLPPVSLQQSLLQHLYPLRGHAAAAVP